jgi:hypothetical protein
MKMMIFMTQSGLTDNDKRTYWNYWLLITVLILVIRATVEITKMKSQLFPNGGTSLNDKVTRLQIEVTKIRSTMDSINKQLGTPKRKRLRFAIPVH